jgi:hypothetical protein
MSNQPTEHEEAVILFQTLTAMNIDSWHMPQETFTKNWGTKMRNKAEGVRKGVPDYLIYIPAERSKYGRALSLWIELKKQRTAKKNGELKALSSDGINISEEQQDFIDKFNNVTDTLGHIAFGADEAIEHVKFYLKSR